MLYLGTFCRELTAVEIVLACAALNTEAAQAVGVPNATPDNLQFFSITLLAAALGTFLKAVQPNNAPAVLDLLVKMAGLPARFPYITLLPPAGYPAYLK